MGRARPRGIVAGNSANAPTDVAPQDILGRLHRVAGQLTRELVTVFERHGLTEGSSMLCALHGEPFAATGRTARHDDGGLTNGSTDSNRRGSWRSRSVGSDGARSSCS